MNTRTQSAVTSRRRTLARIHPSSLGGFTLEGPYRRGRTLSRALDRFFYWLGA
jgi:hypothetical protein